MRNTSFRRRTGLKIHPMPEGVRGTTPTRAKDLTVPVGTPNSGPCAVCGANLPTLTNGNPKGHAAGGVRANVRNGTYKCEGSGRF